VSAPLVALLHSSDAPPEIKHGILSYICHCVDKGYSPPSRRQMCARAYFNPITRRTDRMLCDSAINEQWSCLRAEGVVVIDDPGGGRGHRFQYHVDPEAIWRLTPDCLQRRRKSRVRRCLVSATNSLQKPSAARAVNSPPDTRVRTSDHVHVQEHVPRVRARSWHARSDEGRKSQPRDAALMRYRREYVVHYAALRAELHSGTASEARRMELYAEMQRCEEAMRE
jgi:hypothetical protein